MIFVKPLFRLLVLRADLRPNESEQLQLGEDERVYLRVQDEHRVDSDVPDEARRDNCEKPIGHDFPTFSDQSNGLKVGEHEVSYEGQNPVEPDTVIVVDYRSGFFAQRQGPRFGDDSVNSHLDREH
jgi:hypothetical protein